VHYRNRFLEHGNRSSDWPLPISAKPAKLATRSLVHCQHAAQFLNGLVVTPGMNNIQPLVTPEFQRSSARARWPKPGLVRTALAQQPVANSEGAPASSGFQNRGCLYSASASAHCHCVCASPPGTCARQAPDPVPVLFSGCANYFLDDSPGTPTKIVPRLSLLFMPGPLTQAQTSGPSDCHLKSRNPLFDLRPAMPVANWPLEIALINFRATRRRRLPCVFLSMTVTSTLVRSMRHLRFQCECVRNSRS